MFEPLPADLQAAVSLAEPRLGRFNQLRYAAETDSTNDLALSLAVAGAPEGTAVLADFQKDGRGRRGSTWHSPSGAGLYLSVVIRPAGAGGAFRLLTLGVGVAVARAIHAVTALPVELKWPNDLVIGRPWRKLGGVLSEAAGTIDAVVVGIGVNLLQAAYPPEIADRATSVEAELGRPVGRTPLVVELLAGLRTVVDTLQAGGEDAICRAWRELAGAGLSGAAVRWHDQTVERRGRARDIDTDGALLVESGGRLERLIAGEVRWEGLSRD
jgi:BirA family biotin operon repressor/biotin-[acetyl-CoA-carboxylase] ligase